jgi:N-acyl-D-aspartate/D-glutamate deacylase
MLNFRSSFALDMLDGWKPFLRLPFAEKIATMRDPAARERLRQGAENPANLSQVLAKVDQFTIAGVENVVLADWQGKPLSDYAAERGLSAFDALFDLAVEDDLWATFAPPPMGDDAASWAMRKQVWEAPYVLLGGSDAGAHLDLLDTFALTTQLLGKGVRERGLLTLEEGVRRITSELADVFGLKGRGRIEQGACADLVVFDPDTVACGPIAMRGDLPLGECRLYGDAIGIHHVIVNGVPVARGNEPTGRKGGRVLRSGADTVTVPLAA